MSISRSGIVIASVSTFVGIFETIAAFSVAAKRFAIPPFVQLLVTFLALSATGYATGLLADHYIKKLEENRIKEAAQKQDPEALAFLQEHKAGFYTVRPMAQRY